MKSPQGKGLRDFIMGISVVNLIIWKDMHRKQVLTVGCKRRNCHPLSIVSHGLNPRGLHSSNDFSGPQPPQVSLRGPRFTLKFPRTVSIVGIDVVRGLTGVRRWKLNPNVAMTDP
jgi:hypothetical protein